MNELGLLNSFKALFRTNGLQNLVEVVAHQPDIAIDPSNFVNSLAHDCVELLRLQLLEQHPLAKLATQTRLERATKYEYEGLQVALNLPYGASSILTELYKKLMALIIADKAGRLTLEDAKEELKDLTVWEELLWDYLKQEGR